VRDPIVTKGEPEGMVMAQFDYLPSIAGLVDPTESTEFRQDPYGYLCHGWHPFQPEDFEDETEKGGGN
jgi:hypothetical protein